MWISNPGQIKDIGESPIIMDFDAVSSTSGHWSIGLTAAAYWNHYMTSSVNTAWIIYKVFLAKGTYSLFGRFYKATATGILDVDIDASEVASFDTYAGSGSWANLMSSAGITIASSGLKDVRLRIDGKHASSSGYEISVEGLTWARTA